MNQQEILKKIGGIIAELKEQYTYLEAAGSTFNDLELELFMANANFLTDHIQILKKVYGQTIATLPPDATILPLQKQHLQRPEIPDYFSEEEQELYAEESPEKLISCEKAETQLLPVSVAESLPHETIFLPETMPEIVETEVVENASFTMQKMVEVEEPVAEVIVPVIEFVPEAIVQPEIILQPKIQPEPLIYAEEKQEPVKQEIKAEAPALTLNQRIAAQKSLATAVLEKPNQPVRDLQQLINLNDKLLFVKELFNGYNLAYSEAINILNRYTSFEQAENFLHLNYTVKNSWKDKPATTERFYDILRKRFS